MGQTLIGHTWKGCIFKGADVGGDMCKAADRGMRFENIRLIEKQGGKSGHWKRTAGCG